MASMQTVTYWPEERSELAFDPDLARARDWIEAYRPDDAVQQQLRRRLLSFIAVFPREAHLRACRPGHLTASALVIARDSGRVLLTHHRKLNRWLQLGGHCDGDANLAAVALREAREESGLHGLEVLPRMVDVDIHPIPARRDEPRHLHYDCRFLVYAASAAEPRQNHESNALRWLSTEEARRLSDDPSVHRLLDLAHQAVGP